MINHIKFQIRMGKSSFDVLETVKKLRVIELTLNCFIGNISISSDVNVFCTYICQFVV